MGYPADLKYTKSHEWVRETANGLEIGLTDYAQGELGDLVFVNLPKPGDHVTMGKPFADVESVKAVSDVYSPVTGIVSEVNQTVLDDPGSINRDAYDAWLVRFAEITESTEYLDEADYKVLAGGE